MGTTYQPAPAKGALAGMRVLDLAVYPPGAFATMLLADFGADVVVVDSPQDAIADRSPALNATPGTAAWGDADRVLAHNALRRNKRSVVANLKHAEGIALVRDLARSADVVVEGFRPGVADRLGIGYQALRDLRPDLIYCSVSGFGQTGPLARYAGHDLNYIAYAGLASLVAGSGPVPAIPSNLVADFGGGGLMAAFAVAIALLARPAAGGQYIDMAMTDGAIGLGAYQLSRTLAGEFDAAPGDGRLTGGNPNYHVYECADGELLAVAAVEPKFWWHVAAAVGLPHLVEPATEAERRARVEQLAAVLRTRTRVEWFELIDVAESCVSPVLTLTEALAHPHVRAREMVTSIDDPRHGTVEQVGVAPKLSATPGTLRRHSARPGEHTRAVLRELGRSDDEIQTLIKSGTVTVSSVLEERA